MAFGDIVNQHQDIVLGTVTWPFTPSVGNALIIAVSHRGGHGEPPGWPPAGWVMMEHNGTPPITSFPDEVTLWGRDSDGTETGVTPISGNNAYCHIFEIEGASIAESATAQQSGTGTGISCGLVTPPSAPALVMGIAVNGGDSFSATPFAPGAGFTEVVDYDNGQFHPHTGIEVQLVATTAPINPDMTSLNRDWWGISLALGAGAPAAVTRGQIVN